MQEHGYASHVCNSRGEEEALQISPPLVSPSLYQCANFIVFFFRYPSQPDYSVQRSHRGRLLGTSVCGTQCNQSVHDRKLAACSHCIPYFRKAQSPSDVSPNPPRLFDSCFLHPFVDGTASSGSNPPRGNPSGLVRHMHMCVRSHLAAPTPRITSRPSPGIPR